MKTFGFTLTVAVSAMNEESAQKKLGEWLEPSLALKKNNDIELRKAEAVKKNLNVAREGEADEGEDWDDEFAGLSWDDLGDEDEEDDEEDDDDWEDDEDDEDSEELAAQEAEDDDFGLSALKSLKSESVSEDDEEESEKWGLTW